jgi:hypothetical protein
MRFRCAIRVDLAWQFALRMAVNQRVGTATTPHVASMNMLRMDRRVSSDHSVSQESGRVVRSKMALAWGVRLLAVTHKWTWVHMHGRSHVCGVASMRRGEDGQTKCAAHGHSLSIAATMSTIPFGRQRCAHRVCACGVVLSRWSECIKQLQ